MNQRSMWTEVFGYCELLADWFFLIMKSSLRVNERLKWINALTKIQIEYLAYNGIAALNGYTKWTLIKNLWL